MEKFTISELPNFNHQPPEGMYYEIEEFKRNIFSIWTCYRNRFNYNGGEPIRCIWGFYSSKNGKYYSPVNSKTVGKEVQIENTTPWTSMPFKKSILESCFV